MRKVVISGNLAQVHRCAARAHTVVPHLPRPPRRPTSLPTSTHTLHTPPSRLHPMRLINAKPVTRDPLLPTRYSLLTPHYSLLTTHYSYSLLATPYSLLTTHYSLLTTHYSLLATHYSPLTTDY